MGTILELNIDHDVIKKAEIYAKRTKKTINQLIEDYLLSITLTKKNDENQLGPITSQLVGIIQLDNDIDYKSLLVEALMEKQAWLRYFSIQTLF